MPLKVRTVALVPFNIPLMGLNVVLVGQVVVRTPARFTTSDGDIHGTVNHAFQLTQAQPDITAGNTTQIGLRLVLAGRRLDVRWMVGSGGTWSPWSDIVSW